MPVHPRHWKQSVTRRRTVAFNVYHDSASTPGISENIQKTKALNVANQPGLRLNAISGGKRRAPDQRGTHLKEPLKVLTNTTKKSVLAPETRHWYCIKRKAGNVCRNFDLDCLPCRLLSLVKRHGIHPQQGHLSCGLNSLKAAT